MNVTRTFPSADINKSDMFFISLFVFGSIIELSTGGSVNIIFSFVYLLCAVLTYINWW